MISAANDRPCYAELTHEIIDLDHQDPFEEVSVTLTIVNMTSSTTVNEVCTDNITGYNKVQRWVKYLIIHQDEVIAFKWMPKHGHTPFCLSQT